jgi:hypothetical protein
MLDHAGDQRSSLFCLFVDDEGKKFVTLVTGWSFALMEEH